MDDKSHNKNIYMDKCKNCIFCSECGQEKRPWIREVYCNRYIKCHTGPQYANRAKKIGVDIEKVGKENKIHLGSLRAFLRGGKFLKPKWMAVLEKELYSREIEFN